MIKKILVATDDSESARRAVTYAVDLAATLKATLAAVHVVNIPAVVERQSVASGVSPTHLMEPVEDYLKQSAEALMADLEAVCGRRGVPFEGIVRSGHPVSEIVKAAGATRADLIILGSHGRSALGSVLLGSVALGVIHQEAGAPVTIVR